MIMTMAETPTVRGREALVITVPDLLLLSWWEAETRKDQIACQKSELSLAPETLDSVGLLSQGLCF